jgi:hypothetical protein
LRIVHPRKPADFRREREERLSNMRGILAEDMNNSQAGRWDGGSRLAVVSHSWGIADQIKTGESE